MTVNRFEEIKRFLHLNDNTKYVEKGQPGHDKLHKVRPLIDALNCQLAKNLWKMMSKLSHSKEDTL